MFHECMNYSCMNYFIIHTKLTRSIYEIHDDTFCAASRVLRNTLICKEKNRKMDKNISRVAEILFILNKKKTWRSLNSQNHSI